MNEEEREAIVKKTLEGLRPAETNSGTKIVVTGKGGVGKTAISAALCHAFARTGRRVLAVDGDPQMNLAPTLGLPGDSAKRIVPLNEQLDYMMRLVQVLAKYIESPQQQHPQHQLQLQLLPA